MLNFYVTKCLEWNFVEKFLKEAYVKWKLRQIIIAHFMTKSQTNESLRKSEAMMET